MDSVLPARPTQVPGISVRALADAIDAHLQGDQDDVEIRGISNRSAEVLAGDLYAAVPGSRTHGARFVTEAVERGAVAVLTDREGADLARSSLTSIPLVVVDDIRQVLGHAAAIIYGDPSTELSILAITGTSGKTTTSYLMRAGLHAAGLTCGLIGTVETMVGDTVIKHSPGSSFTTPEAPDLHALLAVMREAGVTHVTMEVSSHALALGRVNGISFAVAGFANLSQDHLDFHHTMEEYFEAKSLLFDGRAARHVINIDDPRGRSLAELDERRAVTISPSGRPAHWRISSEPSSGLQGTTFVVEAQTEDGVLHQEVSLGLPGDFNTANALMALAMLHEVGVPPQVAAPAMREVAVPGRMQRINAGQQFLAVVDYSHKPAAVEAALAALRPHTEGRLILVLGCGGDRDSAKRPVMGTVGARHSDVLIVTDDNPRTEDPALIRQQMLDGALHVPAAERGEVIEIGDRASAIAAAVEMALPGDTVLVAGKGHEQGQYVADTVLDFDDRSQLRAAIAASGQGR